MSKSDQRGAIQLIVLLILLLGLVGGVLLVTRGEPLKFLPKAGGGISGPISPTTSLTLASQKSNYSVGEEVEVQLLVRSDIDAANLFAAKINYDPQFLQLGRVDVTSFVTSWVEQYWGDPGQISLVGGVPTPGFQTQVNSAPAKMATLYFTTLKTGSTSITFVDGTAVYRNSDNADVLQTFARADINIEGVTSPAPSPTITPAPVTPLPQSSLYRRVFVTSTTYNGNLGGLSGGDAKCQERANAAGLGGTWKAWLSSNTSSASSRLEHASVPYRTVDGQLVVNNWTDLTDNLLIKPIDVTETGGSVAEGWAWTATNPNGSIPGDLTPSQFTCDNWSTNISSSTGVIGVRGLSNYRWSWDGGVSCNSSAALYCFEQTSVASTPIPGAGDGNNDGKINLADMSVLLTDFNKEQGFRLAIDMNGDGKINTFDFSLMRNLLIQKGVIRG